MYYSSNIFRIIGQKRDDKNIHMYWQWGLSLSTHWDREAGGGAGESSYTQIDHHVNQIIIFPTNRGGGCEGCGGGGGGGRHPVEEEPRVPVLGGLTLARHHLALLLLVVKPRTGNNDVDWLIKCSRTFYLSTGEELIISSRGSNAASDLLFLPTQETVMPVLVAT